MSFDNILVRATNWVGDAVMSLPALRALRERFPRARISILAKPWVADLYGREPFCDQLIPYEARDVAAKWRAALDLRRFNFDCAILLQNAFEAAAVAWAARIPVAYRIREGWAESTVNAARLRCRARGDPTARTVLLPRVAAPRRHYRRDA